MNPETQTAPVGTDGSIAPVAPDTMIGSIGLPHDLSPWGMFMNADIIVQGIMIGLFIASIITWTVLLAKGIELIMAGRAARAATARLANAHSLAEAAERVHLSNSDVGVLIGAALQEIHHSGDLPTDGIKERIASHLDQIEAAARRRVQRGIGILATIGATAPFVGLFGTVWGIINAFQALGLSGSTSMRVVAPGIANALIATALGLAAAIPAAIFYNHFGHTIKEMTARMEDFSLEFLNLTERTFEG